MKQYLAIIAMDIKLALRLRAVIFFNYLFHPLCRKQEVSGEIMKQ